MSHRKCRSCKGSGKQPLHSEARMTRCIRCGGTGKVYEARMVSARELIGRQIVGFEPGAFPDPPRGVAHRPRILLDDGTHLYFVAEELETGSDYGVFVGRSTPKATT